MVVNGTSASVSYSVNFLPFLVSNLIYQNFKMFLFHIPCYNPSDVLNFACV